MAVKREPTSIRILQDVLRVAFGAALAGVVYAAASLAPPILPLWLDLVSRVMAGLAGALTLLMVMREVVPAPRPGSFLVTFNRDYLRWLFSSILSEMTWHPVVRAPFWYLHVTRVLYLKAVGADVAWGASFHAELTVRDASLVHIGAGAQLEPGVVLEAGLHGAGRVRVGEVRVGEGCLVGAHVLMLPGSSIGLDTRIEPATVIGEDVVIGVGCMIGEGARLERGAAIGSYVTVGTGAIVSEGVRVADRARIAPGALVLPDSRIGEREVWAGVPAQPVPVEDE